MPHGIVLCENVGVIVIAARPERKKNPLEVEVLEKGMKC
jgi:hypothetical protein